MLWPSSLHTRVLRTRFKEVLVRSSASLHYQREVQQSNGRELQERNSSRRLRESANAARVSDSDGDPDSSGVAVQAGTGTHVTTTYGYDGASPQTQPAVDPRNAPPAHVNSSLTVYGDSNVLYGVHPDTTQWVPHSEFYGRCLPSAGV